MQMKNIIFVLITSIWILNPSTAFAIVCGNETAAVNACNAKNSDGSGLDNTFLNCANEAAAYNRCLQAAENQCSYSCSEVDAISGYETSGHITSNNCVAVVQGRCSGSSGSSGTSAVDACTDAAASADSQCATGSDNSYSTAVSLADQLAQGVSTSSVATQCGTLATAVSAANAALGALKLNCGTTASSCAQACSTALTAVNKMSASSAKDDARKSVQSSMQSCQQASQRAASAANQMSGLTTTITGATACAAAVALNTDGVVASSCTNALSSDFNSTTCVCVRNPHAANCGYAASASNASLSTNENASKALSDSALTGLSAADAEFSVPHSNNNQNKGGAAPVGAPGGGGTGGGLKSANAGGGKQAPGAGKRSLDTNINGGFRSGGGPSFGSGTSAATTTGALAQQKAGNGNLAGKVDLSKFLPGGKRDPSSTSMTGPDGITGPYSDNWKKVNNRYGAVKASLHP